MRLFKKAQLFWPLQLVFCFLWTSCQHTQNNLAMTENATQQKKTAAKETTYQEYINFFEEVYKAMDENYYVPVTRAQYDHFIQQFNEKIYAQLKATGKSDNYVRWRSSSLLVQALKTQEDVFSEFYPPEPAKEYEQTALGRRIDLGISGEIVEQGYQVTHVEPRADSYKKGLREKDIIVRVGDQTVKGLEKSKIDELLTPLADASVQLSYLSRADQSEKMIDVVSQDYFKQTVFDVPIPLSNIFCLKIERFNQKTTEDVFRFISYYLQQGEIKGLILDLRGNPGGPPLAARELSGFFLKAGEDFAYFQKKNHPKALLDVPAIPDEFKYNGPLVILIDKESGSASELFAGIMQRKKRAVLVGKNSAGQVMLKSMFHFDDGSMVLLITSRGHHSDGMPFSFDGVTPDRYFDQNEGDEILKFAATYIVYVNRNGVK